MLSDSKKWRRPKLGAPRLLIVGCGDVGGRILARVKGRFRVIALTSTPARVGELRAAGAVPMVVDLDQLASLARMAPFAARVIHLAPPPAAGDTDPRTRHLIAAFGGRKGRLVYVSTTGVYGDRQGAATDETSPLRPASARARRRVAAELALRRAGRNGRLASSILRAPGIYAHDRLPLERLRAGTPALAAADDVFTNHIHADDLARLALAALARGRPSRAYNAVDDSELSMGDYFDRVADAFGLPRPPRLARAELARVVSPALLSFMSESRRIGNTRLRRELRLRLAWPTVDATLASLRPPAIEIGAARASECPRIAEVLLASRHAFLPYARSAHTDEQTRDWVAHTLVPAGGVSVARMDETVVAVIAVSRSEDHNWIDQLYVAPEWVGHGIGERLLQHARAQLAPPLRLYTFQANLAARRFYERHGFVAIGFSDGSGNEEGCPDVLYEWTPAPTGSP